MSHSCLTPAICCHRYSMPNLCANKAAYRHIMQASCTATSCRPIVQQHHAGTSYRHIMQAHHTIASYSHIIQPHHTATSYRELPQLVNAQLLVIYASYRQLRRTVYTCFYARYMFQQQRRHSHCSTVPFLLFFQVARCRHSSALQVSVQDVRSSYELTC